MRSWLALAVIAAQVAALPLVGNNYALRLATTVCMYSVMAQSWNFIGGPLFRAVCAGQREGT